jgi:hypothetical protein
VIDLLILLAIDTLIVGFVLWLAGLITSVDLSFSETVMAAAGSAIAGLVPAIGPFVAVIVLFYLLKRFSRANIWPDILLMVIVSRFLAFVALLALGGV